MMKRTVTALILTTLTFSLLCAPVALAAPAPMGAEDFVIRVGKTDISLLTDDVQSISKASGKKPVRFVYKGSGESNIEYTVSAKEAKFFIAWDTDYADTVNLTKKGVTARGVKIGSTESALTSAYPAPTQSFTSGKITYYYFRAPNAPEDIPDADRANLNKTRPVWFYDLAAEVNSKTKKVTSLYFVQRYID